MVSENASWVFIGPEDESSSVFTVIIRTNSRTRPLGLKLKDGNGMDTNIVGWMSWMWRKNGFVAVIPSDIFMVGNKYVVGFTNQGLADGLVSVSLDRMYFVIRYDDKRLVSDVLGADVHFDPDRVLTSSVLADAVGIKRRYLSREFVRWCKYREIDEGEFYYPSKGYILPLSFVRSFLLDCVRGVYHDC